MMSFCDYFGLSKACSYDVDDVIGRVDRFGFQNFCSPGHYIIKTLKMSLVCTLSHELIDGI